MFRLSSLSSGSSFYIPYMNTGDFDLYPQSLISIGDKSGTLETAIQTKARFMQGTGFVDESLNNIVINQHGDTLQQLLGRLCEATVRFSGHSMHVGYNGMLKVNSLRYAPFELMRLGLPNKNDIIHNCWIKYYYKQMFGENQVPVDGQWGLEEVPRFTEDIDRLKAQIQIFGEGDIRKFKGNILWDATLKSGQYYYPKPVYSSVLESSITEANIDLSVRYDIEDRGKGQIVVTKFVGSQGVTKEMRKKDEDEWGDFVAPDGSRVHIIYASNKESQPVVQTLEAYDMEKVYSFPSSLTEDKIKAPFNTPDILYGKSTVGKLGGDSNEMQLALWYMNRFVIDAEQRMIENNLKKVFKNWHVPINLEGLKIKDFTIADLIETT